MTNYIAPRWRRFAAAGAIALAATAIATTTASTADARIKNGSADFDKCISDGINYRLAHGLDVNMNEIQVGCCAYIGGVIMTEEDGVTFRDCIFNPTTEPGHGTSTAPKRAAPLRPGDLNALA